MLLFGGSFVLAILRWPPLGLIALVISSFVLPWEIGTGTNTGLNVTIVLLSMLIALWAADTVWRKRKTLAPITRSEFGLIAFSIVAVIAFGVGQLPWFHLAQAAPMPAQLGGLAIVLLSAGAFLLVGRRVRDVSWLRRLTFTFLILGGFFVVAGFVPGLRSFVGRIYHHDSVGGLFWTWLVALAFSQAVFNRRLALHWRLGLLGLVAAAIYATLFLNRSWATGWLPALVALVVVLWAGAPRLGLAVTLAGAALLALNIKPAIDLIMINEQYSLLTRLEAWRIVAEIVKTSPLIGLGPANYYWYTPLFPILGWSIRFNSHNQYVDIVAQAGLLGLACFLWFIWEIGKEGWRLRREVPVGFSRAYVYGAIGGLAGTLVAGMLADWMLPFVYNVGLSGFRASLFPWLFLGGLMSLRRVQTDSEAWLHLNRTGD